MYHATMKKTRLRAAVRVAPSLSSVLLLVGALCVLLPVQAEAQSKTDLATLKILAPVSVLWQTPEGNAALHSNFDVTRDIQMGARPQPTLLPFADQQKLALRDAFMTTANLEQLASGLGTKLEGNYKELAPFPD